VRLTGATARPLASGDVIQLGPVQLQVIQGSDSESLSVSTTATARPSGTASAAAPAPIQRARDGFLFRIAGDAICRNWDDVLLVSSQRWAALRDDLTSGRLASSLAAAGLDVWAPEVSSESGTPDERLDAWLATLPTTRAASPELDVYPTKIPMPIGTTRDVAVSVSNVGHRLLRVTSTIEPAGCSWARVVDPGPIVILKPTPVRVRLEPDQTGSCWLVVDGNGGCKRVEFQAIAGEARAEIASDTISKAGWGLRSWLESIPLARRAAALGGSLALSRLGVIVAGGGLKGAVIALGGLGLAVGLTLTLRARRPSEAVSAAISGAGLGAGLAAGLDAAITWLEPRLGVGGSSLAAVALWAVIGAGTGVFSRFLAPVRRTAQTEESEG
jgi:hypothetical protein